MLKKITIMGAAVVASLLVGGISAQATEIQYSFDGNGFYANSNITFDSAGFITSNYSPSSYTCDTDCTLSGVYYYGFFNGENLDRIIFNTTDTGYAAYFPVSDFTNLGTYSDAFQLGATLTVVDAPVPESASLPVLLAGLCAIGGALYLARRKAMTA
jgi:hypothetical protein